MKPTKLKLKLTKRILETQTSLKVNPIVDYDPEVMGRILHNGVFIGYVTFTGRVTLIRGKSKHKDLFIQLDKAV